MFVHRSGDTQYFMNPFIFYLMCLMGELPKTGHSQDNSEQMELI